MSIARRVPYEPDPKARPYHWAHDHALSKSAKFPGRFAGWYADHCFETMTVAQAWEIAPDEMKRR
ncbi:hypothetical protein MCNS_16500 [Mycobacterium conspicuum]|jgi:hypothetical protein|uniref:Uncharacterized protein n=1 Tax=Mycobacterium conspicuum TaxID=44010 RepID=A0A1X1ST75_9MYCO|nr:hypothetical protein AWC00_26605 [Mycobacterium conspicuum]BBZ38587.1 hypothetical protein MCNS_16500 [Mycobacterium conspicuum]CNL67217.1 Uncharacterised protein [Mycobacterium tuberculosis]